MRVDLGHIRLRSRMIALVMGVLVVGIGGTIGVATRHFALDKRDYVLALNSQSAPSLAHAIGKYLESIHDQLVGIDEVLQLRTADPTHTQSLLSKMFRRLRGVSRLEVRDSRGPIARLARDSSGSWEEEQPPVPEPGLSRAPKGGLTFVTVLDGRTYIASLSEEILQESLESGAQGVSLSLMNGRGAIILNRGLSGHALEALSSLGDTVAHALESRGKQAMIVRELSSHWVALAPVPGKHDLVLVVLTPSAQVTELARDLLRKALPTILLISALAILFGIGFARQLSRPLEDLTEATERIAGGQWNAAPPARGAQGPEISKLVHAFQRMGAELEKRERALLEANEQLVHKERLAVLGRFGAGIAHEVKNPLSSILGFAQLIRAKLPPDSHDEIIKYLSYLMNETRRASGIIGDLLTFSRQRPPSRRPVDLRTLVQAAREMLEAQARAAGVEARAQVPETEVVAEVDSDQLYQVLSNLVTNSLHAMEELEPGRPRTVTISLAADSIHARIDVTDTGCGIPPEALERVFEPFFTTKSAGKGTGLGLALCHGIIQQHQGHIDVDSTVGVGTTFHIVLPLSANHPARSV